MGECMGDPRANWYRDAGGVPSSSSSIAQTTATSNIGTTSSTGAITNKSEATLATTNKALDMAATLTSTSTYMSIASATMSVAPKSGSNRLLASPWLPRALILLVSMTNLGCLV